MDIKDLQKQNTISSGRNEPPASSSDRVNELLLHLNTLFKANKTLTIDKKEEWCLTIDVIGEKNHWIQATNTILNFPYPFTTPPEEKLEKILNSLSEIKILSWSPGMFVTVCFASATSTEVAKIIDRIFIKLFHLGNYSVKSTLDKIPCIHQLNPICNIIIPDHPDIN